MRDRHDALHSITGVTRNAVGTNPQDHSFVDVPNKRDVTMPAADTSMRVESLLHAVGQAIMSGRGGSVVAR